MSVMIWTRSSEERCFRIDEIERRTRNVKRGSNWATALSSNSKLAFMSIS